MILKDQLNIHHLEEETHLKHHKNLIGHNNSCIQQGLNQQLMKDREHIDQERYGL
jgi:hypothetical protein